MPPPPGMDAGPEPPPAPRTLPPGFAFRIRLSRNISSIMGLIFTGVGVIATLAAAGARSWGLLVTAPILAGGVFMLKHGLESAGRVLLAFKQGRAVKGRVASVREDRQTTINNRHPWDIVYTFTADGHTHEGKMQTYETATANRYQGTPQVWVLVVDGCPECNTLYPPIK